jgi:ribosomal protein L16/L10AE
MKTSPNIAKFKFKKFHKFNFNFLTSLEQKAFFLRFGQYGLQAKESGKLTFKQIEACRRTLRRGISKKELL